MYNLPFCPTHSYQTLNMLQLRTDDAKLICGSCHLNLVQKEKSIDSSNIIDLVQFKQLIIFRHMIIQKISFNSQMLKRHALTQFFNNFKEQMKMIKEKIEQLLNEFEKWQSQLQQQTTTFLNIIKQDEFKQIFQQLANQDKSVKNEIIQELQTKFYNYFKSIKVMNQVGTQKDLQNLEQFYNNLSQKVGKSGMIEEIFKSIYKAELDYKKEFQPFWHLLINTIQNNVNRQVKSKQPIYRSSKDGLTFPVIKNAIMGKENLLWFFKSSNNQGVEFGAFTPYIWNEGYSGTTEKNPSFLFSKTLNQIYPIRQNLGACTQYFNHEFILFGGSRNYDQDLRINPDFKSGYSRLGIGYQAPAGVDTSKYSTHLFGAIEPNVVECDIYQIIFE